MPEYRRELTEHDIELHRIIKCAFGSIPDDDEYMFLLWYLYEHAEMSFRSVATTVGLYLNTNYMEIYHDVLGAIDEYETSTTILTRKYEAQLKSCGFDDWLEKWLKALYPNQNDEA